MLIVLHLGCICPMRKIGAAGKQGNVYLVVYFGVDQVHSGYGSGDGGSRLDQTASAFYLFILPERNNPNASL